MKKLPAYLGITVMLFLFCTSCNKKDIQPPDIQNGTLFLHIHSDIDSNEVEDYGKVYTDASGRKVSVNIAQMFLSEFELKKSDGSWIKVPGDSVLIVRQEQEQYLLSENVPAGSYVAIRFNTGYTKTTNTVTQHPEMKYPSPSSNYSTIYFAGKIDTAVGGSISQMRPFSFMLGTDASKVQITLPDRSDIWTLNAADVLYCHLQLNYARLIDIDVSNPANRMINTEADMQHSPATELIKKISSMFSYEE